MYNFRMRKFILSLFVSLFFIQSVSAKNFIGKDERAVRNLIKSQVHYANKMDLKKLVSTYDKNYINGDGLNLDLYSNLVQDIWNSYGDIEYNVFVKSVNIENDKAIANVIEKSNANVRASRLLTGKLTSVSNSVYYFNKTAKGWKVVSDKVLDETTSLMYGEAANLNIKMTVPKEVEPDTEYSAILEFEPPKNMLAIASLASDRVEYPQKQTQEVFRALPEDNILERLFISNSENFNEYIVASIGLTKTSVDDLSVKLSLTGFGYLIKRVNVIGADKGGFKLSDVQN